MTAPKIPKVLVAVDFSPPSRAAAERAIELAGPLGARVTLVHALDLGILRSAWVEPYIDGAEVRRDVRARVEADLADLARELDAGRDIVEGTLVLEGRPAEAVVAEAGAQGASLIAAGTHGGSGVARMLLGSVAERIVRGAPCDVLIAHATRPAPVAACPPVILVAHDFSDCSAAALRRALGIARATGAEVEVIHAVEPPEDPLEMTPGHAFEGGLEAACARSAASLDDLVATADPARATIRRSRVVRGRPADAIVEAARGARPALLVLGTHGRRGFSWLIAGSVAERVARTAPCDVLVCRG